MVLLGVVFWGLFFDELQPISSQCSPVLVRLPLSAGEGVGDEAPQQNDVLLQPLNCAKDGVLGLIL
jgi:hypothetical protein